MIDLSNATLGSLPPTVAVPAYERAGLSAGIVHLGMGHFHRAHQAVYLDDLLALGLGRGWAVLGAGVRPDEFRIRDALAAQDGLYTLTEKQPDGAWTNRVVGSVTGYLWGPDDPERLVRQIADPDTRIVGLTITEGGYEIDQVTGAFAPHSPAVLEDLRSSVRLRSAFGVVVSAMKLRRTRGLPGVTIMSCDNVEENGRIAATAFLSFAEQVDPTTAEWMRREVTFPSSMVDRVTPGTVDEDRAYLERELGLRDRWPVTSEPFRQWVLEDRFAAGRPPLEEVGVEVVTDVEPYELAKLRLANGTHQALCYIGHLLGHHYVHEAITDPRIRSMLLRYIDDEAVPTLKPIAGLDLNAYGRTVVERFSNPGIRDPLSRICAETSDRIPKFLLPVVHRQLETGGPTRVCATVVAAWARYALGTDEQGRPIDVVDPRREALHAAAEAESSQAGAFLRDRTLFGDLLTSDAFRTEFHEAFECFRTEGAAAVLDAL
jgi:mannitol 2-dehydrogenase